jgi:hypothetical protein
MTASWRLQLAAEGFGVIGLALRRRQYQDPDNQTRHVIRHDDGTR